VRDGCAGYKTWTDCGWEYDCEYEFAGDIDCNLCLFGGHGGYLDPRTKSHRSRAATETRKALERKA
jgi:hypothetical protein